MSEDNVDILDNITPDGGGKPDNPKPTDNLDPEIQKRDAQIAHWREKATKFEAEIKTLKPQPEPTKPNDNVPTSVSPMEAVKLGKALQSYSEDETNFIIRYANSDKPEDIIKAATDPWVQEAITSRREKVAKEKQIPSPSSPGGIAQGEKSPQEIAKMTREEHIAYEKEMQLKAQGQGI